MFSLYLIYFCFSSPRLSTDKSSAYSSRYRILSTKSETESNVFCFYKTQKEKCKQIRSFGPGNYSDFKQYIRSLNNSVQIIVAENIELSKPLVIGNIEAKSVFIRGKKITGSVFIQQNYQLIDESGVLANSKVLIDSSFSNNLDTGFLKLSNNVKVPPKLITLSITDFSKNIYTTPITGNFYSGPNATVEVTPKSTGVAGGKYDFTISYFGGNLHWRSKFISATQSYCLCPNGNCNGCRYPQITSLEKGSLSLNPDTTLVLVQIPEGTDVTINLENINRSINYDFQSDSQNKLTLHYDDSNHISEFPSLSFSNIELDFDTSNPSVTIQNTNVKLNHTTLSSKWSNKVNIDNVVTDVDSLESVLNNNKNLTIFTNSSEIKLQQSQSNFDQKSISKPIQKAVLVTSNNNIKYSDSVGAEVVMKPESGASSQTIEIDNLQDSSKLSLTSYKTLNLQIQNTASTNYKLAVDDFNNLNIQSSQPISLDHLNLNGTHTKSAHIQSNVPVHVGNVKFEDEQTKLPKELLIGDGNAADADNVYIGENNTDSIQNLKMNKELEIHQQSTLDCSNCSFDNQMNFIVVTGKVVPPPSLQLSKGSADSFNPKSINIFVTSTNESKSERYNITNKQYYPLISGFSQQQQCLEVLKSIVDLPADLSVRCTNGLLELQTGSYNDFWPGEHYTGVQIFGMVLASIICAACSYVIFIYI